MSLNPIQPPTDPPQIWELERECLALVRAIARKPQNIKLLIGARQALQMFAGYKGDRQTPTLRKRHGRGGKAG